MENILQVSRKTTNHLSMETEKKDGALIIRAAGKDLLAYQYETVFPPRGIDPAYQRSGFIHPVRAPHGQVLTRIQPPDHYHHYGIWNPWTHTVFENDTVDFWNLRRKKGTVRFSRFTTIESTDESASFGAVLEHVVFKKDGTENIALKETLTISVSNPRQRDFYFIDISSTLKCATESPLLILAYRYGGMSWRATEYWNGKNSSILTSEGRTRDNSDGSNARWCLVSGDLPNKDYGGILLLSHPSNFNHPEPLRVWDSRSNSGNGDMFVNFCPAKDRDWLLSPGKAYTLRYRFVVFNGKTAATAAESYWQEFAAAKD